MMTTAVLLLGACTSGPEVQSASPVGSSLIELRLVREQPDPGLWAAEFDGRTLYLAPEPLLSDRDLERVDPYVRSGQLFLRLQMTARVAERMRSATAAEIGTPLAIIIDSEVRSAPAIRAEIGGPGSAITVPASEEEANRLAALIRARWPL
jgi:preprotein translocase subunit SecD